MSYPHSEFAGRAVLRPRLVVAAAAVLLLGAIAYGTRSTAPLMSAGNGPGVVERAFSVPVVRSAAGAELPESLGFDLSQIAWTDPEPAEFASVGFVEGPPALDGTIQMLAGGIALLESIPGYTATFHRRERVNGRLLEPESIRVAVRHAPFSVHMRWREEEGGREVLYVEGQNGGKMLVRLAGWKARMLPAISLDPESPRALDVSRHPATRFGLLTMCRELLEDRLAERAGGGRIRWRMAEDQRYFGRDCTYFAIEYATPNESGASRDYRKSVQIFDRETSLPIWVANYGWPADGDEFAGPESLDAATLLEHYVYAELDLAPQFSDLEFDRNNPAYGFRR